MDSKSLGILSGKLSKIKGLVPEAFTEERIDWGIKVFKLTISNFKIWRSYVIEKFKRAKQNNEHFR